MSSGIAVSPTACVNRMLSPGVILQHVTIKGWNFRIGFSIGFCLMMFFFWVLPSHCTDPIRKTKSVVYS